MHLPTNVPRSGGAAISGEHVRPGAHSAAPGLIRHKSNHRSTSSLRTPPPSHRLGRCHAEEYRPKETEVQELRRKRHAQEGGQGRSLPTMWRQRHQAVTGTDEPTEPSAQRGHARPVSVLYATFRMRAPTHPKSVHPYLTPAQPCLGCLQIGPHSNEEKSLFE
jgi:hypothetical protein